MHSRVELIRERARALGLDRQRAAIDEYVAEQREAMREAQSTMASELALMLRCLLSWRD